MGRVPGQREEGALPEGKEMILTVKCCLADKCDRESCEHRVPHEEEMIGNPRECHACGSCCAWGECMAQNVPSRASAGMKFRRK